MKAKVLAKNLLVLAVLGLSLSVLFLPFTRRGVMRPVLQVSCLSLGFIFFLRVKRAGLLGKTPRQVFERNLASGKLVELSALEALALLLGAIATLVVDIPPS